MPTIVDLADIDLASLAQALEPFGLTVPQVVAVAVQDHGYRPGAGNNEVLFVSGSREPLGRRMGRECSVREKTIRAAA